jgi:hypothetical protein
LTSNRWELEAEFSVRSSCGRVGIQIAHSTGKSYHLIPST